MSDPIEHEGAQEPHEGEREWSDDETRDREAVLFRSAKRREAEEKDAKPASPFPESPPPAVLLVDDPDGDGVISVAPPT